MDALYVMMQQAKPVDLFVHDIKTSSPDPAILLSNKMQLNDLVCLLLDW